ACSPSSASPTTSRCGSLAKLARSARRNTPSASPMTMRAWTLELWERDVSRTRPLHSRAGLGGWGRLSLVCIAHRYFVRAAESTRSPLGHTGFTPAIARILRNRLPEIRVVMYAFDPRVCEVARGFGAAGCVPKDLPYDALLEALRRAAPVPSLTRH